MGRLFDNPMVLILILVVILLLFGAPKLPGMARSLGQSMRIFRSEVKEMKDENQDDTVINGETVDPTAGSSATSRDTANTSADSATRPDGEATNR